MLQLKDKKATNPVKNGQRIWVDKENVQKANTYMKTCSTSLVIREIYIKTIMKYPFTLIRMAAVKKQKTKQQQKTIASVHNMVKLESS